MATRRYEQRLRAENAEDTRRRILGAVDRCLREAPTEPVSLERVAQRARVARSTIYLVFGSRAGLFDAFADDLWARTGLPALTAAVTHPDAREHLRGGLAAASKMYAADRYVYRVLYSMARLDPEAVGGAVDKMDQERRGGMAHLARRLADQGVLRDDVSVEHAEHVLWVLCSFEAFDLLYTGCALDLDDVVDLLATTAETALCKPAWRRRRPVTKPARTRRGVG
jgi:AcrR family transcriptional regulator